MMNIAAIRVHPGLVESKTELCSRRKVPGIPQRLETCSGVSHSAIIGPRYRCTG